MCRCCSPRCCLRLCVAATLGALAALFLPALLFLATFGYADRCMWPWDLPGLVLRKGRYQRRVLGRSPAGDPRAYREVVLTEQHITEYFREGYTVVRNALPPHILDQVREDLWREIGPASWPWAHSSFMNVDSLLDMYLFSSLPSIAAQIFGDAASDCTTRVEGQPGRSGAHLYSDFHYFRPATGTRITEVHHDGAECEGTLPANHTKASRLRMWLTLDDDVTAPPLLNQSFFLSYANASELADFWGGRMITSQPGLVVGHFQRERGFPPLHDSRIWTVLQGLNRGDVLIHSPCLVHKSPPPLGRHVGLLCATFAPAESRVFTEWGAGAPFRSCKRRLHVNDTLGSAFDACVPPAYPRVVQEGDAIDYEIGDYSGLGAVGVWWLWRLLRYNQSLFETDL